MQRQRSRRKQQRCEVPRQKNDDPEAEQKNHRDRVRDQRDCSDQPRLLRKQEHDRQGVEDHEHRGCDPITPRDDA